MCGMGRRHGGEQVRMTQINAATMLCFVFVGLLVSCTKTPVQSEGLSPEVAMSGASRHELPKSRLWKSEVPLDGTISSTRDLMDRLTNEQRRIVTDFYDQFGTTVFEFATVNQLKWMLQHGYPTPDDILLARSMTTEQLHLKFEAGDVKAGYFYLARQSAMGAESELSPREVQELDDVARTLLEAGSPFAGYSYFQYQMQAKGDPVSALAGLAWASTAGDSRAAMEMAEMSELLERKQPRSVPAAALLFSYTALVNSISVERPDLLTRRREPYPYGDQPGR